MVSWRKGGVWDGSGLDMPASMAGHAACGNACSKSFQQRNSAKSTYFAAFCGVLPPHNVKLFDYIGFANLSLAHKLGFEDSFQYTLSPTSNNRGLFSEKDMSAEKETFNYALDFVDVPSDSADVRAELDKIGGTINMSLTNMDYIMSPTYKKLAAGVCGMKADDMCVPADLIATNHLKWLQSKSSGQITSRL